MSQMFQRIPHLLSRRGGRLIQTPLCAKVRHQGDNFPNMPWGRLFSCRGHPSSGPATPSPQSCHLSVLENPGRVRAKSGALSVVSQWRELGSNSTLLPFSYGKLDRSLHLVKCQLPNCTLGVMVPISQVAGIQCSAPFPLPSERFARRLLCGRFWKCWSPPCLVHSLC